MFDQNEPDIFGDAERLHESEPFQEVQNDFSKISEEEFLYRYKATKLQYQIIFTAIQELHKVNEVLSEMGALSIDPEIVENTTLLIEDYAQLLEQMNSSNYWYNEENR
jgi:hypothetical protein